MEPRPDDYVDPNYEVPEDPADTFARLRTCPTGLPPFNQLLDIAEDYLEGAADMESVVAAARTADLELGKLRIEFEDALRFQEQSESLDAQQGVVFNMLAILQEQFQALEEALPEKRGHDIAHALQECNAAINQLLWSFGVLKESAPAPQFSESPYVNELIRVGRGYLDRKIALEAFQERFAAFEKFHHDFLKHLEQSDNPDKARVLPLLHTQTEALDELGAFFDGGPEDAVPVALDKIMTATEQILGLQKELQAAAAQETVSCTQCGEANPRGTKFCLACQSKLMDVGGPSESSSLDDGAGLSLNLKKVFDAADAVRHRKSTVEELRAVVDWFSELVRQNVKQFSEMPDPAEKNIPEEQWELYDRALATMETSLTRFQEGAGMLAEYCQHQDPQLLELALEKLLEGQDEMLHMNRLHEEAAAFS